jgi:hypothetical protein
MCGSAARAHFEAGSELVSLLACQTQVLQGRHVASLLLQRTNPTAFLTPDHVRCSTLLPSLQLSSAETVCWFFLYVFDNAAPLNGLKDD